MGRKFNNPKLQKQWEDYEDYLELHSGQAYRCMDFDEFRRSGH